MIELDVTRREDYIRQRGQSAQLTVGPFVFWVNTADGLAFGFGLGVRCWSVSWAVESR